MTVYETTGELNQNLSASLARKIGARLVRSGAAVGPTARTCRR